MSVRKERVEKASEYIGDFLCCVGIAFALLFGFFEIPSDEYTLGRILFVGVVSYLFSTCAFSVCVSVMNRKNLESEKK